MKGLTVEVYRDTITGNCSMDGITSRVNHILLVDGKMGGLYEPKEDEVYLRLIRRQIWSNRPEYIHAVPMVNGHELCPSGCSPCFGGCFVYSSDSRFHELNDYPIPVHDRFEH